MRLERYLAAARPASPPSAIFDPDLLAWARRFLAGAVGNLVITGTTGVGKSWSAWRLGEEILRRGFPGRVEITRAYRFKRLATPPADFAEIDRLTSAGLLALDDIGAVRVSDWDADHLYGAIDDRSEARAPDDHHHERHGEARRGPHAAADPPRRPGGQPHRRGRHHRDPGRPGPAEVGMLGPGEFAAAPPHDLQAERITLGSMMLSAAALAEMQAIIGAGDHYRPAHRSCTRQSCGWTSAGSRPVPRRSGSS